MYLRYFTKKEDDSYKGKNVNIQKKKNQNEIHLYTNN